MGENVLVVAGDGEFSDSKRKLRSRLRRPPVAVVGTAAAVTAAAVIAVLLVSEF